MIPKRLALFHIYIGSLASSCFIVDSVETALYSDLHSNMILFSSDVLESVQVGEGSWEVSSMTSMTQTCFALQPLHLAS